MCISVGAIICLGLRTEGCSASRGGQAAKLFRDRRKGVRKVLKFGEPLSLLSIWNLVPIFISSQEALGHSFSEVPLLTC